MTAFGQKGRTMTTFRQKGQDAIWQKPLSELSNFNFSHMPQQLFMFIDWMGPCSLSLYHFNIVDIQYFIQFS